MNKPFVEELRDAYRTLTKLCESASVQHRDFYVWSEARRALAVEIMNFFEAAR